MPHSSVSPGAEGGFVRVPRSFVTLPVSPGAKCVLLHLCSAADENGESWYSYEDIAALVGRSKASVTAYVRELVEIGLVQTIRQTMANGFNYRRKLRIAGWRDLLGHWAERSRKAASRRQVSKPRPDTPDSSISTLPSPDIAPSDISLSDTECRVQAAECPDPTGPKTKNHQTKTPGRKPARVVWSDFDEKAWRQFRPCDKDPISVTHGALDPEIARKVHALSEDLSRRLNILSRDAIKTRSQSLIAAFVSKKGLQAEADEIVQAGDAIAATLDTEASLNAFMAKLEASWKPHWKRLSSPAQIKACADATRKADRSVSDADREQLGVFRHRAWIVAFHLRQRRIAA